MARAAGDGAVYREKDRHGKERWRGAVVVGWRYDPAKGRDVPVRKTVTGKTEREAAAKVRALIKERDAGRTDWTALTVHAWLDHWLNDLTKPPTVTENTWTGYAVAVTRFKAHVPARLRLDALQPEHFDALYDRMLSDGLKPATVRLQHAAIRRALNVAVRRKRLTVNPALAVDLPTVHAYAAKHPTPAQARAILATAHERDEWARWALSLFLGLRQSEVLALAWDDVDLDAGTVTPTYAAYRSRGHGIRLSRKKGTDERHPARPLPLTPAMVAALRQHRTATARRRMLAGAAWKGWQVEVDGKEQDRHLVFPNGVGRPRSREDDWRAWRVLLEAAGVPAVRVHDARVATATYMAEAGVHPRVAAEILHHSHETMTMHYTKVVPAEMRAAVDAVEALLARA